MACKGLGATRLLTCISSRWVVGDKMGGNLGPKVVGRLFNCGHRLEAGAAFSVLLSIAEASLASHSPGRQPSLLPVETESKFWAQRGVELRPGRYQQQKCPMAKHRQRRSVEPGSASWSLFLAESLNHCCLIMKPLLPEFFVEFFGSVISEQVFLCRRHRDILSKANWTNFYIWLWNERTEDVLVTHKPMGAFLSTIDVIRRQALWLMSCDTFDRYWCQHHWHLPKRCTSLIIVHWHKQCNVLITQAHPHHYQNSCLCWISDLYPWYREWYHDRDIFRRFWKVGE